MKKIIKELVERDGQKIVQCTISDERWYIKDVNGKNLFVPSVTWITSYYPKGIGFYKWLANTGWDESEAIKVAAGDKGSKVHAAVVDLIDGKKIRMDSQYPNSETGILEELKLEEYEAIMSFRDWFNEAEPKVIDREFVVWGNDIYAGTVDLLCEINEEIWLIDNKTSKSIWPDFELQVSAYKHALNPSYNLKQPVKLGILQLGYGLNRKGFKLTEIQDKYELFKGAYSFWKNENENVKPKIKDYPETLELTKVVKS